MGAACRGSLGVCGPTPPRAWLGFVLRPRNLYPPTFTTGGRGPCGAGGGLAWPRVRLPGKEERAPGTTTPSPGTQDRTRARGGADTRIRPTACTVTPAADSWPGARGLYSEAAEISEQRRIHHPTGETAVTEFDTCDILGRVRVTKGNWLVHRHSREIVSYRLTLHTLSLPLLSNAFDASTTGDGPPGGES